MPQILVNKAAEELENGNTDVAAQLIEELLETEGIEQKTKQNNQ